MRMALVIALEHIMTQEVEYALQSEPGDLGDLTLWRIIRARIRIMDIAVVLMRALIELSRGSLGNEIYIALALNAKSLFDTYDRTARETSMNAILISYMYMHLRVNTLAYAYVEM